MILFNTARLLSPLLLVCSVLVLLRGHNAPGGGFVGGLLAAAAFSLQAIVKGTAAARRTLRVRPHALLGAGLLASLGSGVPALLAGRPFLSGSWARLTMPFGGEIEVGTVLLFDVGVYLVVLGSVLLMVFTLSEE
ncbi:MAG: Na+/H+ antiporter subunit B [Bryobacteraceae bacterium]